MNSTLYKRLLVGMLAVCCGLTACGRSVKDRSKEVVAILNSEGFTNVTPDVQIFASRLKVDRDEEGFVIEIYQADYSEVIKFMEQILATPSSGIGTNVDGFEGATFHKGPEGFGFLINETPDGVEVIAIQ